LPWAESPAGQTTRGYHEGHLYGHHAEVQKGLAASLLSSEYLRRKLHVSRAYMAEIQKAGAGVRLQDIDALNHALNLNLPKPAGFGAQQGDVTHLQLGSLGKQGRLWGGGDQVRIARIHRSWPLQTLADKLGVNVSYVFRIETGEGGIRPGDLATFNRVLNLRLRVRGYQ
jgi:hypothetical protein